MMTGISRRAVVRWCRVVVLAICVQPVLCPPPAAGPAGAAPLGQADEVRWHPCDVTLDRTVAPSVVLLGE